MKIENRQKFLLIVTIVVVALWLGNMVIFEPVGKWWSSRSKSISQLHKDLTHGKALILNQSGIHSQWDEMRTNTLSANTSLAEQQLLNAMDNWSQESGATITGETLQPGSDSTNYVTLNCTVEASGDLGTLSRFVYDIEKGPLGLKLDKVEFSTHDNFGQQLTLGLQVSGVALTTLK
jgi:hypothetical protein